MSPTCDHDLEVSTPIFLTLRIHRQVRLHHSLSNGSSDALNSPLVLSISELIFHVLPLVTEPTYGMLHIQWKVTLLKFSVISLAFEPVLSKTNSYSLTVQSFPLKATECMLENFC